MEPRGFIIYPNKSIVCALSNYGHKQYPSNSLDQNNSVHCIYIIPLGGYDVPFRFCWGIAIPLPKLLKYVMEPKGFLIYSNRGIACALNNFGHKQYPFNSLDQNNSINGVYMLPF
jgi:hypothetical protein